MNPDGSVAFFDKQFQRQVRDQDFTLNPFELAALPHLKGRVLDFGCGLGNLAIAAAQRGCSVAALDASPSAISHLRQRALDQALPVEAVEADLRSHELGEDFDCVISIGLLMFFDCPTASRVLSMLQARVRPGGVAIINVLVEGTTYLDMFQPGHYCLFARDEMASRFADWDIIHSEFSDFDAPNQRIKSFVTLIARKPERQKD
ncbi:MAG: methyltransferase domain-containing protein [Sulfuritalea sp.]|jgi:tellurite methyltransferase|nr:methyltransferase domain-containing protein [Sulfuritalea sp.]